MVFDSCRSSAASTSSLTSLAASTYLTRWPCWAAWAPNAISRWLLPVPESPIKQSGSPLAIQAQVARWRSPPARRWGSRRSRSLSAASPAGTRRPRGQRAGASAVPVIALGQQEFGQEPRVAEPAPGARPRRPRRPVPDGGQPQHPAGLVDRGVGGVLGQLVGAARVITRPPAARQQLVVGDHDWAGPGVRRQLPVRRSAAARSG